MAYAAMRVWTAVFTSLCLRPLCRGWELTWENESQFLFARWFPGFPSKFWSMTSLSLHLQEAEFDKNKTSPSFPVLWPQAQNMRAESRFLICSIFHFPCPMTAEASVSFFQHRVNCFGTELIFFVVAGMVLCFWFRYSDVLRMRIILIMHWCLSWG